MAKVIKKKFYEIEIPILNEKYEALANSISELDNKTIRLDITRKLKGKSVDLILNVKVQDNKAKAYPKKMILLPFFIKHMIHGGISYVEDSFKTETLDNEIIIKPFLITRKKVSRTVRKTLRNSANNWLKDYLKTKTSQEIFSEIISSQLQKLLSQKLKKVYQLEICEIRVFEIKKQLANTHQKVEITEIKQEDVEAVKQEKSEQKKKTPKKEE